MKKVLRLNEKQLTNMISKIVKEAKEEKNVNEQMENFFNPEALETGSAIATIIGTVIGLLGISGYEYLLELAKGLMEKGKTKEADEIVDFVSKHGPGNRGKSEMDNIKENYRNKRRK